MRSCPACKASYSAEEQVCAVDGEKLLEEASGEEEAIVLSDTQHAVGAVGTPSPIVRSRSSTPGGSPGGSLSGDTGKGAPDAIVGATLAQRYSVTRKIGEGGMGAVYEARHTLIGKRVAVKVLLDKYAQKADVVARLQQEARLASSIGHEHIVDITDFGETEDGRTFVVMEFLEGESLAQILSREGPLSPQRVVAIARQVASALGAAHGKGVVHRDVKPENVFIVRRSDRDFVKVVDFGISKAMRPADEDQPTDMSPRLTQTGMVLGTPLYMSPEQARGEDELDHRVDVYALGVILYEVLTGEVSFRGTNYLSIISQVLSTEPKPPSVVRPDMGISVALESVVMRAMSKDRALRYQTMAELDADLERIQEGREVAVQTGRHAPIPTDARTRKQVFLWAVGIVAVCLAVALLVPRLLAGQKGDEGEKKPEPQAQQQPQPQVKNNTIVVQQPVIPPRADKKVEMVTVQISSEPDGAEVWMGAVQIAVTPQELEFPKGSERIELTFRKAGYQEGTATFFPTQDDALHAELQKEKAPERGGKGKKIRKGDGTKITDKKGTGETTKQPGDPTGGELKPSPFDKKP